MVTKEKALEAIKSAYEFYGRFPTQKEYKNWADVNKGPSCKTIYKKVGKWADIANRLNYDYKSSRGHRKKGRMPATYISDEELRTKLLKELREVVKQSDIKTTHEYLKAYFSQKDKGMFDPRLLWAYNISFKEIKEIK